MKRVIYRVLAFLCVLSLLACMFVAYAEMNAEKESEAKGGTPVDVAFQLPMARKGQPAFDNNPQMKTASAGYAYYILSTITNTSSYPIYINVRNAAGTSIEGTAHTIYSGTSTPYTFNVYYLSGHGNVGTSYCPSGQTYHDSPVGAYVEGDWHP